MISFCTGQSGQHAHTRRAFDFYSTPAIAVDGLLRAEHFTPNSRVWEPAAGDGAVAHVLRAHGFPVICSDIVERAFPLTSPATFSPSRRLRSETLLTGLPHHTISEARDFVRLHDDETNYWSPELCFVNVPIVGQKKDALHLITEDIAMQYLPNSRIQRFRLALATKPHDSFFLCHVPTRNLDNQWNQTNLDGCMKGRTRWVQVTSRREEGYESYKINYAKDQDAFPTPNWPSQSLIDLILRTFDNGRQIEDAKHPGLLRLIGARQELS